MKKYIILLFASFFISNSFAQKETFNGDLAAELANTMMYKWPDSLMHNNGTKNAGWSYDIGLYLEAIGNVYARTDEQKYFDYIVHTMDNFIGEDGSIRYYKQASYNIDYVRNGKTLLYLYEKTGKDKYLKAAQYVRKQLDDHPRTSEGGFWHKKVYPHQMWLDGLYMGQPFYANYSKVFNQTKDFDDIALQFILMEKNARDAKTGLLYHGWDESKEQTWANKETGKSPNFWGRAMGWYGVALVDVLDYFPVDHPKRKELIAILNRYVAAVAKVQDKNTGLWYQVLDKAKEKGNYLEASASSMFVYTFAKACRLGYVDKKYHQLASKGFEGIKKNFLERDAEGRLHLNGTVQVSGLGGKPYRDGSFEYYISEPVIQDDPKGMGAFILAANELLIRFNK